MLEWLAEIDMQAIVMEKRMIMKLFLSHKIYSFMTIYDTPKLWLFDPKKADVGTRSRFFLTYFSHTRMALISNNLSDILPRYFIGDCEMKWNVELSCDSWFGFGFGSEWQRNQPNRRKHLFAFVYPISEQKKIQHCLKSGNLFCYFSTC